MMWRVSCNVKYKAVWHKSAQARAALFAFTVSKAEQHDARMQQLVLAGLSWAKLSVVQALSSLPFHACESFKTSYRQHNV